MKYILRSKAVFVSITFLMAIFLPLASADYGPVRGGITHPATTANPSFNNYIDAYHSFFEDERYFAMVSKNDNSEKGDSISIDPAVNQSLIFHAYMNNSGTENATGVKVNTDSFYQNSHGNFVTEPFNTSINITHYIEGANTNPAVVWDTATVVSQNSNYLRLKYIPTSTSMWVRPSAGGTYYVEQEYQTDFFGVAGIPVGSRSNPLGGVFEPGDQHKGEAGDNTVEFKYFILAEKANADLSITKNANLTSAGIGNVINYNIVYNNAGPIEAKNVVITDDYDETKLAINGASLPAGCSDNGSVVTCNVPVELANGASGTLNYSATAIALGSAQNSASISSDMDDLNTSNNTATDTVNIVENPTSPGSIIINELAWAGSKIGDSLSTADEWIELRNTTNQPINISGWQLTAVNTGTESLMLEIPSASIVPPYGYFLISNYAETSASSTLNVTPDVVNTAVSLSNTVLKITLYNGVWNMGATGIDIAGDGGAPLAGSNGTPKASMARKWHGGDGTDADNWFTHQLSSGFDAGATEKGSPGNSTSTQNQAFPETVYEDAESGDIVGWKIFGTAGATITNVNDSGNRIISTSGDGLNNMYRLYKVDDIGWNNEGQFIAQWKMKHLVPNNAINTNFRVFWRVIATDKSVAYIGYKPGICAPSQTGNTIIHCINFVNKGDFYTFTRNLQADYSAVAGGNLVKVHGFLVRGDVDLDDIKLLSSQTGLYNISGNITYDHDNNTGTAEVPLENALISFSGRPPVYTDASGNYTQDGFADKGSYTVTVEKAGVNFATSTATVNINSANATQNFSGGIPDATPTVYEDAEDSNTDGWDINDNSPAGATIANIVDDTQGRVIEFIGNALVYGVENGNSARLRNADGTGWNNNGQFNISYDIKGIDGLDADADNDDFVIYVSVNTTAGQRWLKYSNSDTDFGNDFSREVHHGLGSNANDGTWRTFTRNLQTDLNADPPSGSPETILSVNELRIRGSLRVDNIELQ